MSDTIRVLRYLQAKATPSPWDAEYVRRAVRHIARNCDFVDGDDKEFGWDRYNDAPLISATISALPVLLDIAEAAQRRQNFMDQAKKAWVLKDSPTYNRVRDEAENAKDDLNDALSRLDRLTEEPEG